MGIDIQNWAQDYDDLKYPTSIYDELVVKKLEHRDRFRILGAWKTGCISRKGENLAYQDEQGKSYYYTNRWKQECPIGYQVWNEIAEKDFIIASKVPINFTENPPEILIELSNKTGFGFVWSVFVLHCVNPETFPLYDQHVYRAYRWIESNEGNCPSSAPNDWLEYYNYSKFFKKLIDDSKLNYWTIDRGLWVLGKSLKHDSITGKISTNECVSCNQNLACSTINLDEENGWIHETTLGGKHKKFWWKIDDDCNLSISRNFNLSNGKLKVNKHIMKNELDQLNKYMVDGEWKSLSNNVAKLKNGTEKDGIGKFLYEKLHWTTTEAQLSSHIGSIFYRAGVWEYNGNKRGIMFRQISEDWCKFLKKYYCESIKELDSFE